MATLAGGPFCSEGERDAALILRYRDAGFEVIGRGLLAAPDWSQLRTSWAKRLRGGGSRTVLHLIAREIPIA